MERRFLVAARRMTRARLVALVSTVRTALSTRTLSPDLSVPGARDHVNLVRKLLVEALSLGVDHAERVVSELRKRSEFSEEIIRLAMQWLSSRSALAGRWNRDLDSAVVAVLNNALSTGASLRQTLAALRVVFEQFAGSRLEAIARTEATAAWNHGVVLRYEREDVVVGYQWEAVLDSRTCPLCASRDGMIILKGNPGLEEMEPPVHVNCRCVLVPVTRDEYKSLSSDDPSVRDAEEERMFLPEMGPQTLEEALDWSDVPPPMPGFGRTRGVDYRAGRGVSGGRRVAVGPGGPGGLPRVSEPGAVPGVPSGEGERPEIPPIRVEDVREIRRRASEAVTKAGMISFLLWLLLFLRKRGEGPVPAEEDEEDLIDEPVTEPDASE